VNHWLPPASVFTFVSLFAAFACVSPARAQTVSWAADVVANNVTSPTSLAFGPDGRLYVLQLNGRLHIFTLGPDGKPISVQVAPILSMDPTGAQWACLGLSFDPLSPPDSVRVYISRTRVFQPSGVGAYLGRLTRLTGPDFDQPVDVISGLPVSRMDHANNGTFFGDDGNLYLQQGGNTNSGMPGEGLNGFRDEGPLSAATLIAYVRRPGFDGRITYSDPDPALAHQTGGFDVQVFAPGFRNPYDLVMHTNGLLYGTDNGPNVSFTTGTLWDCDSIGPTIFTNDELVLIEQGRYYGHPNRNRAALDPRQCRFHPVTEASNAEYTAPLRVVTPSTNGILEYRSRRFASAIRGDLFTARYEGGLGRATLSSDGRAIPTYVAGGPMFGCLDIAEGPDGTLFGVRYATNQVLMQRPVETPQAVGPVVWRLWPERGPHDQARTVSLYGTRLALGVAPTITLDGVPLTVTAFDSGRVTVVIPPMLTPGWRSLAITTSEGADFATNAYRVIRPTLTDGDSEGPTITILEPERRYHDRQPPTITIHAYDRLGLASAEVQWDGGPWQVLAADVTGPGVQLQHSLSNAAWQSAAPGMHEIVVRATDDAGRVTLEGWSWIKGLPSGGVRINSGGAGAWSSEGLWFSPDSAVIAGHVLETARPIAKTLDQSLYRDARASDNGQPAADYRLQLPNRAYSLRLGFAEIDTVHACAGCRVFDVMAEDESVIPHIDLGQSPGAFHAVEHVVETLVMDGELCLTFGAAGEGALISAIEVYPLGLDDVTPPTIMAIPEPQGSEYTTSPRLTLSASDPADGELFALEYSIDNGPWRSVASRIGDPTRQMEWTMPILTLQQLAPGMHQLRVRAVDLAGRTAVTPPWSFARSPIVGVDRPPTLAAGMRLWPNPARGAALRVAFAQPRAGAARVRLFDVAGRTVLDRALGWQPAGASQITLDLQAHGVPAGLYFVRFDGAGVQQTERIVRMP